MMATDTNKTNLVTTIIQIENVIEAWKSVTM